MSGRWGHRNHFDAGRGWALGCGGCCAGGKESREKQAQHDKNSCLIFYGFHSVYVVYDRVWAAPKSTAQLPDHSTFYKMKF